MKRRKNGKLKTLRQKYSATFLPFFSIFLILIMSVTMFDSIRDLFNEEKEFRRTINDFIDINLDVIREANGIYDSLYGEDIENKLRDLKKAFSEVDNDPNLIDLKAMKLEWGANWDLYVIDSEGVIVATTYPSDQGMDFSKFAESFFQNLTRIRETGELTIDKITRESSGSEYRKYGYLSSENHRYILEVGLRIPIDDPLFRPVNPSYFSSLFSFIERGRITIDIVQLSRLLGESQETYEKIYQDMLANDESYREEKDWSHGTVTTYSEYKGHRKSRYPTIEEYLIVSTFSLETFKAELMRLITLQSLQLLCVLFVGLMLLHRVVRSLAVPIHNMIDDISRIAQGEWDHQIAPYGSEEFMILKTSVKNLVSSLKIEKEVTYGRQTIIEKLAYTHRISGLPNLHAYYDRRSSEKESPTAVVLLNLDDFSRVNTAFGHEVGNDVIQAFGRKIGEAVNRKNETVNWEIFHINTDGLLLVSAEKDRVMLFKAVEALFGELSTGLFLAAGREFFFTVSMGAVICDEGHKDSEQEMLRKADIAMEKAKGRGKNTLVFFEDGFAVDYRNTYALVHEIWDGIRKGSLRLVYQPIVDVGSTHPVGFEALLRTSPDINISPLETIKAAEDSGLIHPLGSWILREAISRARSFVDSGLEFRYISINISPLQFREQGFPGQIADLCREMGVAPDKIQLEITETALMKFEERMISVIHELKDLGFRIAMDDFGTGYSSLAYLARLPIDVIKIEKYMTNEAFRDAKVRSVVILIMKIASELHLEVIAEGIENDEHARWMVEQDCVHHQGYYYSKPIGTDQINIWLENFYKDGRSSF